MNDQDYMGKYEEHKAKMRARYQRLKKDPVWYAENLARSRVNSKNAALRYKAAKEKGQ